MKTKSKLYAIGGAALIFLAVTWWANGRDDTWLYVVSAVTMLTSFTPLFSKQDEENN